MNLTKSVTNRFFNLVNKDSYSWVDNSRNVHLQFREHLESIYPTAAACKQYGSYKLPEIIEKILSKYPVLISGGVEFHIDFEVHIADLKPLNVHFFEVDPKSIEWFRKNYSQRKDFKINHIGLSSEIESLDVYGDPQRSWSSCVDQSLVSQSNRTWQVVGNVKTTTIANYCKENNIESIGLLKLDIEGYAPRVISSCFSSGIYPKVIAFEIERGAKENVFAYMDRVYSLLSEAKRCAYQIHCVPRTDGYSSFSTDFVLIHKSELDS